jgi:hypothetical protein
MHIIQRGGGSEYARRLRFPKKYFSPDLPDDGSGGPLRFGVRAEADPEEVEEDAEDGQGGDGEDYSGEAG